MPDPTELTIHDVGEQLAGKKISSEELTRAVLDRIRKHDGNIHAYLLITDENALKQARESDARRKGGTTLGPLDGIPLALKDNLCTRGTATTCASRILEGYIPPYDATVVSKLRAAGAIFTGKTNMDEFAMGSSTEHSAFGPTRNPWDFDRVPGGSSGGSAAAVAADMAFGALGSDTGGSIRQPAALTGVVGLKPTYGRVSRYGLVAFASSLDQIGPLAKNCRDAAILLDAIDGLDSRDSTSAEHAPTRCCAGLAGPLTGFNIGIADTFLGDGMDAEVTAAVNGVAPVLEKLGCTITTGVKVPSQEYGLPMYYLIAPAEASSNLARYDGVLYGLRKAGGHIVDMYKKTRSAGFGAEVKRRIILGTYVLSAGYYDAYYLKALKGRTRLREDFALALTGCHALLSPATPTPAFRIGEKTSDPLQMYLTDIFTVSANLAGLPGLVLPCGLSSNGLPIGVQLVGKAFDEATLLQIGHQYEQATRDAAWRRQKPPLGGARG